MRQRLIWTLATLAIMALVAILFYRWVAAGSFKVCVQAPITDAASKTLDGLDKIIDVGMTLSTSLVGLGAALLIGLKGGIRVSLPNQLFILVSLLFFVQSAFYAVLWRIGAVDIRINECIELLTTELMERRFSAHFTIFILGLASLGALVISAIISNPELKKGGNT
jgi:hypothetical protein